MRLSVLFASVAVAMVAGLLVLSQSGQTRIGPFQGEPLDPETYRAQIVAIDAVLFEDVLATEADRSRVVENLTVLGRIASGDEHNSIARVLTQNMRTLAGVAGHTRVGTPLVNSPLRQNWLRIRNSLFADAYWFRYSSADPVMGAVEGPPPPSPLKPATEEQRRNLDIALLSMEQLVHLARNDLDNAWDSDPHRRFVDALNREAVLDSVRLGEQPRLYESDLAWRSAWQAGTHALRSLNTLADLGGGAPRSSREYLIGKAEEHLAEARRYQVTMAEE